MKTLYVLTFLAVLIVGGFYTLNTYIYNEKQGDMTETQVVETPDAVSTAFAVTPIAHATAVFTWGGEVIYMDPTGGTEAFAGQPAATLVLVTDIHGDHLSTSTLVRVVGTDATLIVPEAVKKILGMESGIEITAQAQVLGNGATTTAKGFSIEAVSMYNLPESEDSRHTKGRGNGYVIERDGYRVYVAGDTADIPEMRALKDIDVAFIPMNLPFTMDVKEAADAVLAFKPKQVYPYHYRGQGGLSDVNKFKELVNAGDPSIEVVQLNWYPEAKPESKPESKLEVQ